MAFSPFEVTIPHVAYACLGGFVVLFGMFSLFLREKLYIGEACWAFLFGVIIGPYGANIFNPHHWGGSEAVTNTITLEFTRVVLAIGVFAIGVELPKAYMARHWKSLLFLLFPVMTWGWFVSAGLIYAFIPGLNFLSSLAVAACLTPTDPILAAAVVGGKWADKHVPAHIRHLLAAESGCNDGAAFPFLFISLYLLLDAPNTGAAIRDWFLDLWLYQVILGIVIGSLIGFGFRHLMKFCQRHNLIDRHSYVAQYISLAMLTIGICTLLGSDDLLAAFACGTAFAWDGFFNRQTEESVFSSVIDLLFNVAAFVYVGAWMPFSSFQNIETTLSVWRLIVIAILVLILRRLPIMVALYKWIPDIKNIREAVFSGHFGPIGIGAVFISTLASEVIEKSPKAHDPQVALLSKSIQPIVAFMVLCSITIHGLSIPSFSLGRRVHTVSRTWSRHAPPDWTTSARIVERGAADIVINRDSVMERGELRADAKASESRTLNSSSQSMSTPEKDQGSIDTRMEKVDLEPTEGKSDTPPDGTETVMEWTEGNQRIIERRSFPGDDVEVEVVDIENPTTPTSGLAAQLRQSLHGLVHHLSDSQDNNSRSPADVHANPTAETSAGQAVPEAEDDGGWASEEDGSERGSQSSSVPKKKTKTRPRSQLLGAKRQVRQRNPPRRSSGTPPVINLNDDYSGAPSSSTTPPNEESDSRGRSNRTRFAPEPHRSQSGQDLKTLIRPSSIGDNMGAPRNQRLTHIRALHSSPPTREASPSRSAVRFLDDTSRTPEAQD